MFFQGRTATPSIAPSDPNPRWDVDRLEAEILHRPFGAVAREVEDELTLTDPAAPDGVLAPEVRAHLRVVLVQARAGLEQRERDRVAAELASMVERSGLDPTEFAARCGVPPSRLDRYLSGCNDPRATFMVRARSVAQGAVHDAA